MSQAANNFLTGLADASFVPPVQVPAQRRDTAGRFQTVRQVAVRLREMATGVAVAGVLTSAILTLSGALDASGLFTYFDIGGARAYAASAPTEEYVNALYLSVVNDKTLDEESAGNTQANTQAAEVAAESTNTP